MRSIMHKNVLDKVMDLCSVNFSQKQLFTTTVQDIITDPGEASEFMHVYRKDTARINSVCRCLGKLKHPLFKDVQVEKTVCRREAAYRCDDPTDSDYAANYYKVFEEVRVEKFLPDWDLIGRVIIQAVIWTPGSIAKDHDPGTYFKFLGYLRSRGDLDTQIMVPADAFVEDNEYWDHNTLPTSEQISRIPELLEDDLMENIEAQFERLKKLKM